MKNIKKTICHMSASQNIFLIFHFAHQDHSCAWKSNIPSQEVMVHDHMDGDKGFS